MERKWLGFLGTQCAWLRNRVVLEFGTFNALNRALMFKWVWRFFNHPGALWVSVVKAVHGIRGSMVGARVGLGSIWRDIVQSSLDLQSRGINLMGFCKCIRWSPYKFLEGCLDW